MKWGIRLRGEWGRHYMEPFSQWKSLSDWHSPGRSITPLTCNVNWNKKDSLVLKYAIELYWARYLIAR